METSIPALTTATATPWSRWEGTTPVDQMSTTIIQVVCGRCHSPVYARRAPFFVRSRKALSIHVWAGNHA